MEKKTVQSVVSGRVLQITLNNPENGNLLDVSTVTKLLEIIQQQSQTKNTILVLKAKGKIFSKGRPRPSKSVDDNERLDKDTLFNEMKHSISLIMKLNETIQKWPGVSIAAVKGGAHGAATGLLTHCDVVISERNAVFSIPEITYGVPPTIVNSYLARALIPKTTLYLLLTGREISATTAHSWGLVSEIVPVGQLEARVKNILSAMKGFDERALFTIKGALQKSVKISESRASAEGLEEFMRWFRAR